MSYTAHAAVAANLTGSYTDEAGNILQAFQSTALASASTAGRAYPIGLASGDFGARALTSATLSAAITTGTGGLALMRRIGKTIGVRANIGAQLDFAALGKPRVYNDSCLVLLARCTATTAINPLEVQINIGEG